MQRKGETMYILNGIRQIRVTSELSDGAADGSAEAIDSTAIQQLAYSPVYIEGQQMVQRGGDDIKAVIEEEDRFLGVDITIDMAGLEPELKAAIAGGTVSTNKWLAPKDSTEMPYPFRLKVWVANYEESDSNSEQDGFIEYEFPFCKKGKLGSATSGQQAFTNDQFTFKARRNASNPSSIEAAITHDKVSSIV